MYIIVMDEEVEIKVQNDLGGGFYILTKVDYEFKMERECLKTGTDFKFST